MFYSVDFLARDTGFCQPKSARESKGASAVSP